VLFDEKTNRQYCGHDGMFYSNFSECAKKPWDVKFYSGGGVGEYSWYVIRNPQVVARWSATSKLLEQDLIDNKAHENGSYQIKADATIKVMYAERAKFGEKTIENQNARLSILKVLKD